MLCDFNFKFYGTLLMFVCNNNNNNNNDNTDNYLKWDVRLTITICASDSVV